jgi:anaerobic ribonucleoside-triphosphate reductase
MVYNSQVKKMIIRHTVIISETTGILKRLLISGFNKQIITRHIRGDINIASLSAYQFTFNPLHCMGISLGKKE